MVPTKLKGFCSKVGPRMQGLLESTKKNWGSHAFLQDNYLNKNADISIFLKKEGKDIFYFFINSEKQTDLSGS